MLCDRCGKREATVQYIQVINGNKQELHLCSKCGKDFGIDDFYMPIDLSGFLGDIFSDYDMPLLTREKQLICENCKTTFDEFLNTGKIGCANCYKTFEKKLKPILNRIQGGSVYLGNSNQDTTIEKIKTEKISNNEEKIAELERKIKEYIKKENYEEAAKVRDEIKKLKENPKEETKRKSEDKKLEGKNESKNETKEEGGNE